MATAEASQIVVLVKSLEEADRPWGIVYGVLKIICSLTMACNDHQWWLMYDASLFDRSYCSQVFLRAAVSHTPLLGLTYTCHFLKCCMIPTVAVSMHTNGDCYDLCFHVGTIIAIPNALCSCFHQDHYRFTLSQTNTPTWQKSKCRPPCETKKVGKKYDSNNLKGPPDEAMWLCLETRMGCWTFWWEVPGWWVTCWPS